MCCNILAHARIFWLNPVFFISFMLRSTICTGPSLLPITWWVSLSGCVCCAFFYFAGARSSSADDYCTRLCMIGIFWLHRNHMPTLFPTYFIVLLHFFMSIGLSSQIWGSTTHSLSNCSWIGTNLHSFEGQGPRMVFTWVVDQLLASLYRTLLLFYLQLDCVMLAVFLFFWGSLDIYLFCNVCMLEVTWIFWRRMCPLICTVHNELCHDALLLCLNCGPWRRNILFLRYIVQPRVRSSLWNLICEYNTVFVRGYITFSEELWSSARLIL